ncbi:carbohydrate ABC transporter permease, partial [Streptomyces rubiginosohelvolus]
MTAALAEKNGTHAARPAAPEGPPPATPRRGSGRERAFDDVPRWQIYVPRGIYLIFTLVPFYWMFLFAVRPAGTTSVVQWPMTGEHFSKVWTDRSFAV